MEGAGVATEEDAVSALFGQALAHHQAARLGDAEQLYLRILSIEPGHADSLHLLGVVSTQTGRHAIAVDLIRKAIGLNGRSSTYHSNLGSVLQTLGRMSEAVVCYRRALALNAQSPEAYNNLGNALQNQKLPAEALSCFRRALALRPDFPAAANNLAITLRDLGRLDEALACCRAAIALHPDAGGMYNNLAIALRGLSRNDEASAILFRALQLDPRNLEAMNTLGNTFREQGRMNEAVACFRQAIDLRPDYAEAHNNLGCALRALGRQAAAAGCFRRALTLKPDFAEAHNNLGLALRDQSRLDGAVVCHHRALALKPVFPDADNNLGIAYQEQGRFEDALDCFQRVLALSPGSPEAHNNLGLTLEELDRPDDVIACYRRAIDLKADFAEAHKNLAMALLARGDLGAGWAEYEWRWKTPDGLRYRRGFVHPQWRGEVGDGRILLIHAEQGYGDSLQFCRYVPLAAARGWRIVLEVPEPLLRLLSGLPGVERLVAQGADLPPFDVHCPMLSLPLALGTTLATIPAGGPYLRADDDEAARWERLLADEPHPRVGLVWAGRQRSQLPHAAALDRRRSLAPDRLVPLLEVTGPRFFSLQKDGPAVPAGFPVIDVMAEMRDFADTAALIVNLDLVISVDTAVAHLAAALGKPVWLLDRFDPCWRWFRGRSDSPWYPTLHIFRQSRPGDWDDVLETLKDRLRRWCEAGWDEMGGKCSVEPSGGEKGAADPIL